MAVFSTAFGIFNVHMPVVHGILVLYFITLVSLNRVAAGAEVEALSAENPEMLPVLSQSLMWARA